LPDFAVFLHADAPEHVPGLELLTDSIFAAARGYLPGDLGFVHFAHNYVLHEHGCGAQSGAGEAAAAAPRRSCEASDLDGYEFPTLWKAVFGASVAPSLAAGEINAYCCVQFMVRGTRIRLRPWSFYHRALTYFGGSAESYHRLFPVGRVVRKNDALGRTPCQLAMYIWHAMFGEPLKLPRRQNDPHLPLFMKLQNIELEALDEETAGREGEDPIGDQMLTNSLLAGEEAERGSHSTQMRMGSLF